MPTKLYALSKSWFKLGLVKHVIFLGGFIHMGGFLCLICGVTGHSWGVNLGVVLMLAAAGLAFMTSGYYAGVRIVLEDTQEPLILMSPRRGRLRSLSRHRRVLSTVGYKPGETHDKPKA